MAKTVTATKLIRVAPGTIWKKWCDLPHWARWQPGTIEARWLEGTPWEPGSTFILLRRGPFRLLQRFPGMEARRFVGKVLSVAEEQLLVWELTPTSIAWFGPVVVESVRLDPAPGGTTVLLTLTAHGLGPTLFSFFLGGPLKAQVEATLEGLHRDLASAERRL
ncbi:MAG: SRPBCC family protein [Chloroflexota bacterium]|nr:SRPBCC family protein [Chloroflexota bacterium]